MSVEELAARFDARKSGHQWVAQCPCPTHGADGIDKNPSLLIWEHDGRPWFECKVGCRKDDILSAIGLTMADVNRNGTQTADRSGGSRRLSDPIAWFAKYCGVPIEFIRELPLAASGGEVAFRFTSPDVMKYRRAHGHSFRWKSNGDGTPGIWPSPGASLPETVWLTEGETDCVVARYVGLDAHALTHGAGSTLSAEQVKDLAGRGARHVIVCLDADDAGHKNVPAHVTVLRRGGLDVSVCDLTKLTDSHPKDLREFWLGAKGDMDGFRQSLDSLIEPADARSGIEGERNRAASGVKDDPWPERRDLPAEVPNTPPLPAEMIPGPLRDWLVDFAGQACMPLEYPTIPALVALGSLIGRRIGLRPNRYDDFLVVPNLWGAIVGRPGSMKSNAVSEGLHFLRPLALRASDRHENDRIGWEAREAEIRAEIDAIKKRMAKEANKTTGKGDMTALKDELAARLRDLREGAPRERRYLTQDATIEKIGELLNENPDGLLVCRDELAGWLCTLDKPGHENDRPFYLEGWNGTGSFTVDRIGRGTLRIPAVCLSIVGGIQPGKLGRYISAALSEGWGDDGLLQRLQLLVWPDGLREWKQADRPADADARKRAQAIYETLDEFSPTDFGAEIPDEGGVPFLRFSPPGQTIYDSFRHELENRLRSNETNAPGFEAHLAKYRSLMPKLALVFHLVDGPVREGVSEKAARLATKWCAFLESHARKVYASELSRETSAAHRLAEKITEGAICDGDTVRDLIRSQWSGLSDPARVIDGLETLTERGWVKIERKDTGGRPSEIIRLHPDLRNDAERKLPDIP